MDKKYQSERLADDSPKNQRKSSSAFRVKTTRMKYQTPEKRVPSGVSIKSAINTQSKFHNTASTTTNLSIHRGCMACRKRPIPGEYKWKKLAGNRNP